MTTMKIPITVVINTFNSAKTLRLSLESIKDAQQIVIVDMHSSDDTRKIASEYTKEIYLHPPTGYVEPARNFAIEKANQDWILVLDSDEEVPPSLLQELNCIAITKQKDPEKSFEHVFIPRKNMIFGVWLQHAGWWPDNQLRFFKKGTVIWQNEIHSVPIARGHGFTLSAQESNAIVHHHYTSVSQWIQRMDRYTSIQADELIKKGYTYSLADNLNKPFSEFLRRFFAWEGYKDGVIGLNIALLQALSELVVYLKVRELQPQVKTVSQTEFTKQLRLFIKSSNKELQHWLLKANFASKFKKIINKILN